MQVDSFTPKKVAKIANAQNLILAITHAAHLYLCFALTSQSQGKTCIPKS